MPSSHLPAHDHTEHRGGGGARTPLRDARLSAIFAELLCFSGLETSEDRLQLPEALPQQAQQSREAGAKNTVPLRQTHHYSPPSRSPFSSGSELSIALNAMRLSSAATPTETHGLDLPNGSGEICIREASGRVDLELSARRTIS